MNRVKSYFTLVELLVVIGIIIILAGILLPVTQAALKKADNTKALAQIKALESAIVQFKNDMGYYPDASSYDGLIKTLQNETVKNKRNTRYLDILEGTPDVYTDPWGNDFVVLLDDGITDADGYNGEMIITIPGVKKKDGTTTIAVYYYSIIIYSKGSDGADGTEGENADNIYSFPTSYNKKTGLHTITK
ncbi:MAG: type II secretion system protein GspG [Lentisphaeria bacterium]